MTVLRVVVTRACAATLEYLTGIRSRDLLIGVRKLDARDQVTPAVECRTPAELAVQPHAHGSSARIHGVAQSVADGIDRQHGQEDRETGRDRQPWCDVEILGRLVQQVSPTRRGRLHAEAEE
jgi:hypothetical protein